MKKHPINFTYFGIFFFFLLFTAILNVFLVDELHHGEKLLYYPYAIGQVCCEVMFLISMTLLLKEYFSKVIYYFFIGSTFLLLIFHMIDFTMGRIFDLTIFDGFSIVANETLENFLEMINYWEIPKLVWLVILLAALSIPCLGVYLFKLMQKVSPKPVFKLSSILIATIAIIGTTFLLDFLITDSFSHFAYHNALPLKTYFLPKKETKIAIDFILKKPIDKAALYKTLHQPLTAIKKPNIFLFIIDSLREDYLTQEISPAIHKFKHENIYSNCAIASANATQLSWFSIFYAEWPFFWKQFDTWQYGAAPLNILKKAGYKINVYTSAQLGYYETGDLLFGKNLALVDNLHFYSHYGDQQACDSDRATLDTIIKELDGKKEGNIFIIFLDSAHWSYSYPKDFPLKFTSLGDKNTDLIRRQIAAIKNRYRNAIHYVDMLFDNFINQLKVKGLYDDAIIVATGDHGQEFFEHGHIFHLSHLNNCQTRIPLYFKVGKEHRVIERSISHIDIFPTILDVVLKEKEPLKLFSGKSIFQKVDSPYTITTRFNAGKAPFEFFIHNGDEKLTLRFSDRNDIFHSKHLQVLSLKTAQEEQFVNPSDNKISLFQENLKKLLAKQD
jgi:glucan phosphoethanolaminetransferase (alkaline phosphatase superfamily)